VTGDRPPVRGWELSLGERADLAAAIAVRPAAWVGQEPVEPSTTPTLDGAALVPRQTSVRTFTVTDGADYILMPGALGHAGTAPQTTLASDPLPTPAKDVWVLASEPDPPGPAAPSPGAHSTRDTSDAASLRSAENLFRLGRHLERAEATVRLLLTVSDRWDDYHARPGTRPGGAGGRALQVLLGALHRTTAEVPLAHLVTDVSVEGSLAWTVAQMGREAAHVRDNLSGDFWLTLSSTERALRRERERRRSRAGLASDAGLAPTLLTVLEALLAAHGTVSESLVRDVGWHLLDAGRRLERAHRVVATLAATLATRHEPAVEELVVTSVLAAHESGLTFRRRYRRGETAGALELLLRDHGNPRSLAFQLDRLDDHRANLPVVTDAGERDRLLAVLADAVDELDTSRAVTSGTGAERCDLAADLATYRRLLEDLTDEVVRVHLSRPAPSSWSAGGWQA